jgi:hypothetical protein
MTSSMTARGDRDGRDLAVPLHWRAGGVSLVLDCSGPLLPRVLHWGADLSDRSAEELAGLAVAATPQQVSNNIDEVVPVSVIPEQSVGWIGSPGLTGHRNGAAFSTAFTVHRVAEEPAAAPVSHRLTVAARDAGAELSLLLEFEMTESGLVRLRATLTNEDADSTFMLDGVLPTLPVPTEATELLDFTGRHLRERTPQRQAFTVGTRLRENRRGRTGADASIILAAGTAGFGFTTGEVWGVHVAWSGNHRTLAERTSTGVSLLGGGELLLAGEVRLAPGEAYRSRTENRWPALKRLAHIPALGKPGGRLFRSGAVSVRMIREQSLFGRVRRKAVCQLVRVAQRWGVSTIDFVGGQAQPFPGDAAEEAGGEQVVVATDQDPGGDVGPSLQRRWFPQPGLGLGARPFEGFSG